MKTMKTFVLFLASTLLIVNARAQFSENFDTATINSLTANCWVLNGVSTTTQNGEAINGTSIYTAPPVNVGSRIDLYTPILSFASSSTVITFNYRLTNSLGNNSTRSIQVSLVNLGGQIVASDTITMNSNTNTDVQTYNHTFNPIAAGNYRVAFRLTGVQGNGNVRLVFDNLLVSNSSLSNTGTGGCNLVPIADKVLPIKLISFDAKYVKPNVVLNWSTAQEKNFSHFVLEQSTDGINFNEIAVIFGSGESDIQKNYSYLNSNMSGRKGLLYYRLKSVDIDNMLSYSSVRIIRLNEDVETISLATYPNPVSNEVHISIPADWQNKKVLYEMFNVNGQTAKRMENANSSQTETVNVSNLNSGLYIVKVTCEGKTAQQKIIKQ